MNLKDLVRGVPDFPQPGVMFRDFSPLLKSPEALEFVAKNLFPAASLERVEYFVGIESRGFILAMLLAHAHRKGFIPLRKAGKLPPPTIQKSYNLEYGKAAIEMSPGQGKVILVDDVLATGGTLEASVDVCTRAGYELIDVGVLIDLTFLNKFEFRGQKIRSLIQY